MDTKEVLRQAIRKAAANGCNVKIEKLSDIDWIVYGNTNQVLDNAVPTELFYHPSHQFAQALWGEHDIFHPSPDIDECKKCGDMYVPYEQAMVAGSCWAFHLMGMVISTDPITYLDEHIPQ